MSLKSWLMPTLSQRFLSRERLLRQRAAQERKRRATGAPHCIEYFHQPDDPYSALTAQALQPLLTRYDMQIKAHIVGPPSDAVAPKRAALIDYSRRDAALLAARFGLVFSDPQAQPSSEHTRHAARMLVAASKSEQFALHAAAISSQLWQGTLPHSSSAALAAESETEQHMAAAQQRRARLGHYLGASFFYAGEWYWGIDRLHHLERRLQDLGAARAGVNDLLFPPAPEFATSVKADASQAPVIDFFVSLRSPYSAIVTPRIFKLAQLSGAELRLRYVLPMVMRGLPVPREKRIYISTDTAREAHLRDIPFGRLNDPVGRPTERGLAVLHYAETQQQGHAFLQSFMHGVWAEGIDAGSTRGLRLITERAGLSWAAAEQALSDPSWRAVAEDNRCELFALGLWGVPSFRLRDTAVWGQDRLWAIEEALQRI